MKQPGNIVINFTGGIISPGDLYNITVACKKARVHAVRFGLRQQLIIDVDTPGEVILCRELELLKIRFHRGLDGAPNIMSSYPAEEVFIHQTWLGEGVYKDIFDGFEYEPKLKINISDCNQSFTPLLTGNINWVASHDVPHYWYCFIRFPRTNIVYEARELVYTNDIARMSAHIEETMFKHAERFIDNPLADGDELFSLLAGRHFLTRKATVPAVLPAFNLPYYEGFNRYNNKYWLGIYQRDEQFTVDFLQALCRISLDTKIGQVCATPWKSIIIKSIEEKDRVAWNRLLARFQVNVRHAANELNFQVEDNCAAGLKIKEYLVRYLNDMDMRTFGLCIGIKTRRKSEVFSSILIRRRPLFTLAGVGFFHTYDVLCAEDYNPNKRTGWVYSSGNPKWLLPEQLRRAIVSYQRQQACFQTPAPRQQEVKPEPACAPRMIHQCSDCLTVYNDVQTPFEILAETFCCPLCDGPKSGYTLVNGHTLGISK